MPKIEQPTRLPETGVIGKVRKFISLKRQIDDLTKEQSLLKTDLSNMVDAEGEADDKGHLWYRLPVEVEGYVSLQRQQRVSKRLDEDVANRTLIGKKLKDRCYKLVPVLDEEEVLSCFYEGLITEAEVDAMYPRSITWAFVPSKS